MDSIARKYRAELRLVIRAVVAGALAYLVAEALSLPQSYWAVVTALIVVQTSLGGTIAAGFDRFAGTFAGAALGALAALAGKWLALPEPVVLVLTVAPLTLLGAIYPSFRLAPVTAVIVLLAGTSNVSPLVSALHRVSEIGLGTIMGIVVSTFVLPSRAKWICLERSADMLRLLGETLALHLQSPDAANRAAIDRLNDRTLAELGKIKTAAEEAHREHAIRLAEEFLQGGLVRSLRRLRSDVAFVGRATASGDLDWQACGPVLDDVSQAFRAAFDGLAEAMLGVHEIPRLDPIDAATAMLRTRLNKEAGKSPDAAVLPFVLDTLRADLVELADGIARTR